MLLDSIGMNTLNWHCCNHEMTTVSTVHWNLVKTRVCQDSNQRKQMRDPLVNQWVFSPCHVCIRIHWSFFVATTHECCEWIEVLQIIQLVATLTARGENSTCTWADWIPTACCSAIHKRVWSVFGSPFLRKRMFVDCGKTSLGCKQTL